MKRLILMTFTILMTLINSYSEDIRKEVISGDNPFDYFRINPSEHIFGIKFETKEDDVITKLGKPDGYVRLTMDETVMIYGKNVGFIFDKGKLSGVRITPSIYDHNLMERSKRASIFNDVNWSFENGIGKGSTLTQARESLGDALKPSRSN